MIEIEIKNKGIDFSLPEKWEEVNYKTLEIIGDIVWQPIEDDEKSIVFVVEMGKLFYLKSDRNIDWNLIAAQVIHLGILDKLKWIWQCKVGEIIIPNINAKGKSFIGPTKEMSSISVLEWAKADEAFFEWLEELNADKLSELCGILYRLRGVGDKYNKHSIAFKGDERESFNVHILNTYAKNGSYFSPALQRLIAWQYYCNRMWMVEEFEDVFSGGDGDGTVYEMMLGLSGETFGTLTDVQQAPLIDILVFMNKQIKDAEKLELERKKNNL